MAKVEKVAAEPRYPETDSCCLSRWTFRWMNPLLAKAALKDSLDHEDLYVVKPSEASETTADLLEAALEQSRKTPDSPVDVQRALVIMLKRQVIITAMVKLLNTVVQVIPFIALRQFLMWQQKKGETREGVLWIMIIFLCMAVKALTENVYFHLAMMTAIRVRTALLTLLYKKTMRLSLHARQSFSTGEVVNLMQIWTMRLEDFFCMKMHVLWDGAVQILCYVSIALWLVGPAAVAGIIVMFPLSWLQRKVMIKIGQARRESAKSADSRVRMITEIFSGIRAIKSYAWEKPWSGEVERLRGAEIKQLRRLATLNGVMRALMSTTPQLILFVVFIVYSVAFGSAMEPAIVFTTLAVFQNVRFSLLFYPMALAGLVDAKQAIARMQTFLNAIETAPQGKTEPEAITNGESELGSKVGYINIDGATLSYRKHGETQSRAGFDAPPKKEKKKQSCCGGKKKDAKVNTEVEVKQADPEKGEVVNERVEVLRNIKFDVTPGALVAVVGPVGCGKSSLVSAVLGELVTLQGSVSKEGRIAYASQSPWIMNATVKENVLFHREFDQKRYEAVLDACCLRADLDQLTSGDETEIGERGITLSGGQKQRVSLARTLYTDADIYVFDDPLSALDAETASAVFNKCICSPTLKGKTRLLITHALFTLPASDLVVVLEHDADGCGQVKSVGPPATALSEDTVQMARQISGDKAKDAAAPVAAKNGKLAVAETKAAGSVKAHVYLGYFKAVGSWTHCITALVGNLFSVLLQNGSVFWLSIWADGRLDDEGWEGIHYCLGYGAIGLFTFGVAYISAIAIIGVSNRASYRLHKELFQSVLTAPLSFFDTTPLGRILNRFSHDVESMDTKLPDNISMLLMCAFSVFGMLLSISIAVPYAAFGLPILFVVYGQILQWFRVANREIKRLDSIALSPIFAHFQQSLAGIPTIRAYGSSSTFTRSMMDRINHHTGAHYCMKAINRWLSVRLELLGAFVFLTTGAMAIYLRGVSPGFAGVALVYALQCTGTMNWTVRTLGETEASMNCAERIMDYIKDVPSEAAQHVEALPPSWPENGAMALQNISLRYRPGLPLVLNDLSVNIEAAWRVGVVGRTGSGKSTLLLALMRMVELEAGSITIGGRNTASVGLTDLRSKIAVIPQDPVLWTGSLRKNLDPFGFKSNEDIWNALRLVGQQAALEQRFPGSSLDAIDVSEFGENFSHGQRQLFCLARAMLKDSKVVLMDEATSALDEETDTLVQKAVRELFTDATMLIVAHRLRTIAGADRILVLHEGTRVEFDEPKALLSDSTSRFSKLVDELGVEEKNLVLERAGVTDVKHSAIVTI